MKPLILIFILCGKPDVYIGHDKDGMFIGSFHNQPNPVVTSRLLVILRDKHSIKQKYKIETILGGNCA